MGSCDVDIITGEVLYEFTDVYLPTAVPVVLTRRYVSSCSDRGILGWGTLHNFTPTASIDDSTFEKHDPIGGNISYPLDTCNGEKGPRLFQIREDGQGTRDGDDWLRTRLRRGQLLVEYPDGSRESYFRPLRQPNTLLPVHRVDADDNWLTFDYSQGSLTLMETSEGFKITLTYGVGGYLRALAVVHRDSPESPLIRLHYEYGRSGDLVGFVNEYGQKWRYGFVDHLLVRWLDPANHGHNYAYDSKRRCLCSWQDGPHHIRRFWRDDLRHTIKVADSYGTISLVRCTDKGALLAVVDPMGNTAERILDGEGGVLATVDPDGVIRTTHFFDSKSGILTETDGTGGLWQKRMDPESGQMTHIISPLGNVRQHEYDRRDRLVKITAPNGGEWRFAYDRRQNVSQLIDPLGYEIRREELTAGRIVRFTDQVGLVFEQRFDHLGRILVDMDAAGRATTFEYNNSEDPTLEIGPSGDVDSYEYDVNMDLIKHRDALGRIYSTEYDASGNIICEVDPMGNRVTYTYDLENNLVRVENEKREVLNIRRDALHRELELVGFDGRRTSYKLDSLDRRTEIVDALNRRTLLTYQSESDVGTRTFFNGTIETYEMNPDGQYIAITYEPHSDLEAKIRQMKFEYSPNGHVSAERYEDISVEFEWDLADHFISVRDSLGDETRYVRGARHRIDKIIDLDREYRFRYLPTGEVTEIRYPNGLCQEFDYDGCGRMSQRRMLSASGEALTWRRFKYDACSQLIETEDWHWGRFGYKYDARGRLVSVLADDPALCETYKYDVTNNLVNCPIAQTVNVDGGNRVRSAAGLEFEYDANGNLVSRRDDDHLWRFEWDPDGQLSCVKRDGAKVAEYEYDLLNGRVAKTAGGRTIRFIHVFYSLRAEIFDDGTRNHYLSLADMPVPIAQCRDGEFFYYGYDQIGTPIEVFDESGQLVLAVRTQAYGGARQEFRPTAFDGDLPFGFMGQYRDMESNLHYNQFRYYDAVLGRYISQDPMGILSSLNFYAYPTNPNNVVDPLGLMPTFQCLSHWTPCAQRYVKEKVVKMNQFQRQGKLKKTCTECRKGYQRQDFKSKRCGGGKTGKSAGAGRQVDHIVELQCGGYDRCCNNLASIPDTFNNDLGKQVKAMIKNHKVGDRIGRITISGCNSNKPCGDAAYKRYVRLPKEKRRLQGAVPKTGQESTLLRV